MKQRILIASNDQEVIEELSYILNTLDYNTTVKQLKTIWVVHIPEDEFHNALMTLAPFVEVKGCPENLFWAFNNKKQGTFENVIAVANSSSIEEFIQNIKDLANKGLTQ